MKKNGWDKEFLKDFIGNDNYKENQSIYLEFFGNL